MEVWIDNFITLLLRAKLGMCNGTLPTKHILKVKEQLLTRVKTTRFRNNQAIGSGV